MDGIGWMTGEVKIALDNEWKRVIVRQNNTTNPRLGCLLWVTTTNKISLELLGLDRQRPDLMWGFRWIDRAVTTCYLPPDRLPM